MSLFSTMRLFSGWEQGDNASLTADGHFYRCFVWLNRAEWRIEAACFVAMPNGEESLVFHNVIEAATAGQIANVGDPLDSPKIIASGPHFVVHFLQASSIDGGSINVWNLSRAVMDMESFDTSTFFGWEDQGNVPVYGPYALYDVHPVVGAAASASGGVPFIVARSTAADEITVERFTTTNFLWAATAWSVTIDRGHTFNVLAVYAHEADNDVLVSYQRTADEPPGAGTLWTAHLDADDGGSFVDVQTFVDFSYDSDPDDPDDPVLSIGGANYLNVTHERVGPSDVAICAEAQLLDLNGLNTAATEWIHHVAFRQISSSTAARAGNEHWASNLHLCSRMWAYDGGSTSLGGNVNLYVAVSAKSLYETGDWEQAAIFVVNLNYDQWQAHDSGSRLTPRPICSFTADHGAGIPDARASGYHPDVEMHSDGPSKRMNHLSGVSGAPPFGPDIKTRTIAIGVFASLAQVGSGIDSNGDGVDDTELVPQNAGIQGFKIYMEDPWTIFRDSSDPEQPVDNFKGSYPRPMCQSVEAGRSLFISGGVPALYDGKQIVESGYPMRPEIILTEPYTDGAWHGALDAGGTYLYYAIYSWRDAAGQVHTSGPSRPITVVLGALENGIALRLRALTLSMRDASCFYPLNQPINIEIFRTENGGTIFYRVFGSTTFVDLPGGRTRPQDTPYNKPWASVGYIDVLDGLADAELVTQGEGPYQYNADLIFEGPLPVLAPAMTTICAWQNRVFGAPSLDPSMIWYSDEIFPDFGATGSAFYQAPVWSTAQTFRVGEIGEITMMQPMNDALIIGTTSALYALAATNLDSGLLDVHLEVLHEATGCIDPRSVVLGPPGIFFQSAKGYYLLNRGKELDFANAGASIEADVRFAGNIRAAVLKEDEHKILLSCNGRPYATTTFDIPDDPEIGTWSLDFGVGDPVEAEAGLSTTGTELASALDAAIGARRDIFGPKISAVASPGSSLVLTWNEGVEPSYVGVAPETTLEGTDEYTTLPRTLVYDYMYRSWSRTAHAQTFPDDSRLSEVVDACAWRGHEGESAHVVLVQGGLLVQRAANDSNVYADQLADGSLVGVPIDIQSAWFHAAGIAGYQRLRSIHVIASKPNESEYSVDVDYVRDGNYDAPESEIGLNVQTISPARTRVRPAVPKAHAHRVRIYEAPTVGASENIQVTGLVFEVGLKKRPGAVADTQIAS